MKSKDGKKELVNQCLGVLPNGKRCSKKLPRGIHLCPECRKRTERIGGILTTGKISDGRVLRKAIGDI